MKFHSKDFYLMLHLPAVATMRTINGQDIVEREPAGSIEFKNHLYATTNEANIRFIRGHALFGKVITEVDATPIETPAVAPMDTPVLKTKNEIIAFLVKDHGASPDDLKGKKLDELKAYALDAYGVTL